MVRTVPVGDKWEAKVDDADYELVTSYKWSYQAGYAAASIDGKKTYLHHFLLGRQEGAVIDHANRHRLDNRRDNLRHVSISENNRNIAKRKGLTSVYLNVSFVSKLNKWQGKVAGVTTTTYKDEWDCARACDRLAIKLYGTGATTNNTLTTDEIRQLNAERDDQPPAKKPKGEKYIHHSVAHGRARFRLMIPDGKGDTSVNRSYPTLEEAIDKRDIALQKTEEISIQRNAENDAIIELSNKPGMFAILDDDWYRKFWGHKLRWQQGQVHVTWRLHGKSQDYNVHRVILDDPDGRVTHLDGNPLKVKKGNFRSV